MPEIRRSKVFDKNNKNSDISLKWLLYNYGKDIYLLENDGDFLGTVAAYQWSIDTWRKLTGT